MLYQNQNFTRITNLLRICLLLATCFTAPYTSRAQDAVNPPPKQAPAGPQRPPDPAEPSSSFAGSATLSEYFFGKNNVWDKTYDEIQDWKKQYHFPISIGADHWFNLDRNEFVYGNGYGVPNERGTYYYYISADPSLTFHDGFVKEIGAHVQFRIREYQKVRAFFSDTYWFYEAYAYAKTAIGTFKAGQVGTLFGLPFDGTWWESVPSFDGYRFDPDYGVSWENQWKISDRFLVDSVAQFFINSDGINVSLQGGDAESAPGLSERNTGVLRVVPTWKLDHDIKIQWGISGLAGGIKGRTRGLTDRSRVAFGSDVTLTWKNLTVFGEYIDAFGATNPVRYVSGGPSDRVESAGTGIAYQYGPARFHVNYSYGWDHNPDGHQFIFNSGISLQLTKNVTFYGEYVKWDVVNRKGDTAKFADGFELIAVWNL